jgi:[acyl-carrier-protein] S-malonyltransferase
MASELLAGSAAAGRVFQRADDILGYRLSELVTRGGEDELNRTVHTQPAVFATSIAVLEALREQVDLSPVVAGGHSLGEFSALVAAGALDFDDALRVIRVRAEGMESAQPPGTCGMAAVLGLNRDEIESVVDSCREDGVLEAANFNSPDQVVVSGHLSAVRRVVETVKERKRTKAVMLSVSSAFHTCLMEPAREKLREALDTVTFHEPRFPVVANVNGQPYSFPNGAKQLIVDQLVHPVLWEDCVRTMSATGATRFVEVGPGKVLSGLLRRIDRKATSMSVSDLDSIRRLGGESQ